MVLFTIGHSNHSIEKLIELLESNGVMLLADVRTTPASRYNPQFNRENLEQILPEHDIQYAFTGQYLGGRPSDPTCYKKRALPAENADYLHEVDYPEVMKRAWFIKGIERLLELADEQTTAIMCSEEDPSQCHRHHLIARYLLKAHPEVTVRHIRGDGTVFRAEFLHGSVDSKPMPEQPSLF
ncbi:MAG: DUF488 domain-containing protein [Chloroflexi bacterium]|nr:DUF488 domain-containing protein [Chloroflexota bacterium]MCL5273432.1 DUF488 domain-containing protein [Chloroflexota bacterium]